MKTIQVGAVTYPSIKAAVEAYQARNPGIKYITAYQRLVKGVPPGSALGRKPRFRRTPGTVERLEASA